MVEKESREAVERREGSEGRKREDAFGGRLW